MGQGESAARVAEPRPAVHNPDSHGAWLPTTAHVLLCTVTKIKIQRSGTTRERKRTTKSKSVTVKPNDRHVGLCGAYDGPIQVKGLQPLLSRM